MKSTLIKRNNRIIKLYASNKKRHSVKILSRKFGLDTSYVYSIIRTNTKSVSTQKSERNEEMKSLILLNPRLWTVKKLSNHFNISYEVVRLICSGMFRVAQAKIRKDDTELIVKCLKQGLPVKWIIIAHNIPKRQVYAGYKEFKKGLVEEVGVN